MQNVFVSKYKMYLSLIRSPRAHICNNFPPDFHPKLLDNSPKTDKLIFFWVFNIINNWKPGKVPKCLKSALMFSFGLLTLQVNWYLLTPYRVDDFRPNTNTNTCGWVLLRGFDLISGGCGWVGGGRAEQQPGWKLDTSHFADSRDRRSKAWQRRPLAPNAF